MVNLRTAVEINAAPTAVWAVLVDFAAYPEWNPVEVSMKGEPIVGTILEHTQQLTPGGKKRTFRPTIVTATPERELAWRGKIAFRGIFDVHHRFSLEPLDGGKRTTVHQDEHFSGVLVPLTRATLKQTERAFVTANNALKARVETRV